MKAIVNAQTYRWQDWLIGIMRSFLSGGSAALVAGGGGALAGITARQQLIMMGSSFVGMGLYRMGEFLQLHGAPEKVQAEALPPVPVPAPAPAIDAPKPPL